MRSRIPPTSWQSAAGSTNVEAFRYEPGTASLYVRFLKGKVRTYRYYPVTEETFWRMLETSSRGRFVIYVLIPNYKCDPVG